MATVARGCWTGYPSERKINYNSLLEVGKKVNISHKGKPCVFNQVRESCVGGEKRKTRPN